VVTIHCTKKLLKRLPYETTEELLPETNRLGSWCANVFNIGRIPYIIFTNEQTLCTAILPYKQSQTVYLRFLEAFREVLHSMNLKHDFINSEIDQMRVVQFDCRTNKKTLGSMNDFVFHARYLVEDRVVSSLNDIEKYINGMPCAPLKYRYPRESVIQLLSASRTGKKES
jgi:hypothetical protein